MNSRYQLCEEAERKIRNGRLKCESNDLVRWARESGLSYGLFMNALYQRNIKVILKNKHKEKPKSKIKNNIRDPEPYKIGKARMLNYYVGVFDRESGEEVMKFNTVMDLAVTFGIGYYTTQNMINNPETVRRGEIETIRGKYIFRKIPKEIGVIVCGQLDEECD